PKLPHVLLEELQAAAPRERGTRLMIARPLIAVKAVTGIRMNVDLAIWSFLLDDLYICHRNTLVLLAEMHLRWTARFFVSERSNPATVITDRGGQIVQSRSG